jgi:hypothetical protein
MFLEKTNTNIIQSDGDAVRVPMSVGAVGAHGLKGDLSQ